MTVLNMAIIALLPLFYDGQNNIGILVKLCFLYYEINVGL